MPLSSWTYGVLLGSTLLSRPWMSRSECSFIPCQFHHHQHVAHQHQSTSCTSSPLLLNGYLFFASHIFTDSLKELHRLQFLANASPIFNYLNQWQTQLPGQWTDRPSCSPQTSSMSHRQNAAIQPNLRGRYHPSQEVNWVSFFSSEP